jgi:hypothetical protein
VVAGHIDAAYWWLIAIFYLIIGQGNWGTSLLRSFFLSRL